MASVAMILFKHFDANDDGKINLTELSTALAVDTDNDGVITDIEQSRTITNLNGDTTVTTWNEADVLAKAIDGYLANEATCGNGDGIITKAEFQAIFDNPFDFSEKH